MNIPLPSIIADIDEVTIGHEHIHTVMYENTPSIMKVSYDIEGMEKEADVMRHTNTLHDKGISDNFIYIYGHGIYDSNKKPPGIRYGGEAAFIVMEKADGRLGHLLREEDLLVSATFQLLYGLAAGIHHLSLDHGDIALRNILAIKCDHDRLYKVGKSSYLIPSGCPRITYADFDMSTINSDTSRDVGCLYEVIREIHETFYPPIEESLIHKYIDMMEEILKISSRTPTTVTDILALFHLPYFDSLRTDSRECETFSFYL